MRASRIPWGRAPRPPLPSRLRELPSADVPLADRLEQPRERGRAAEGGAVADAHEEPAGAGHRNVQAARVAHEAELALRVAADEAGEDHVLLAPLEGVHGADLDALG